MQKLRMLKMNQYFKSLNILTGIFIFITAFGTWAVEAQSEKQAAPKEALYQTLLGKSVSSREVAEFIAGNKCTSAGEFQLCIDAGMALRMDFEKIVKTVYLYSGNADRFHRYQGELPFGLSFYDPMWLVEEKLSDLEVNAALSTTWKPGMPDQGSSPDHIHYWAVYKRFGVVVIYSSPFAEEDAYIYAILVNN